MTTDLIFDVGMNNGDDTAYYLHRGYRVVAIEADPALVAAAAQRFASEIKQGRLTLVAAAIAEQEGVLPFWICDDKPAWSSFDRSVASRNGCRHHQIDVSCCRFSSLLSTYGVPYYLKVDIEGGELSCLQDLRRDDLPSYVSVEYSGKVLLDTLHSLGYTRFKGISQYAILPLEIPASRRQKEFELIQHGLTSGSLFLRLLRRAGLAKLLNKRRDRFNSFRGWSFPEGSSGPFGEDLPGRWHTYAEMCDIFSRFQREFEQGLSSPFWDSRSFSFWVDLHAGMPA